MALVILTGCTDDTDTAAPASATPAVVSEKRTLGCGAGVVELAWTSETPVRLVLLQSNHPDAAASSIGEPRTGDQRHTSAQHTLTWRFENADGEAAEPTVGAVCRNYY